MLLLLSIIISQDISENDKIENKSFESLTIEENKFQIYI